MGLPDSGWIPRVPPYSGRVFVEGLFSLTGLSPSLTGLPSSVLLTIPFLTTQGILYFLPYSPSTPVIHLYKNVSYYRFGLFRFRSPLLPESRSCFLFLRVLRWFTSPGFHSLTLFYSCKDNIFSNMLDYSIRLSRFLRMFAPTPGFSQLTTTFFSIKLLGIHRRPFLA